MCYFPKALKPQYKTESTTNAYSITVGCGKCMECRQRRSRDWIFRLLIEQKQSITSHFITLTYADQYVPKTETGLPTIDKKDFQKFMKRLRKKSKLPLKYYACGEYGGRTQRPHYHAIIFNLDPTLLDETWSRGHTHYAPVNSSSIAYVTGYVNKYIIRKNKHQDDDRQDEFNLISRGIGASLCNSITEEYINLANSDKWQINGDFYIIPRYIKDKLNIGDDVKETIKEEKQKSFRPLNELSREELRIRYGEMVRKRKKQEITVNNKAKI